MASIKSHGERWRVFVCVAGQRKTKVLRTKREALAWASATESALRELSHYGRVSRHQNFRQHLSAIPEVQRSQPNVFYPHRVSLLCSNFTVERDLRALRRSGRSPRS